MRNKKIPFQTELNCTKANNVGRDTATIAPIVGIKLSVNEMKAQRRANFNPKREQTV